jgi:hypothetical protein
METKTIETICSQIYKRFPEVSGSKPRIQTQKTAETDANYLMIFRGSSKTQDGKTMPRTVRVVVSERGKILKVTTSR